MLFFKRRGIFFDFPDFSGGGRPAANQRPHTRIFPRTMSYGLLWAWVTLGVELCIYFLSVLLSGFL